MSQGPAEYRPLVRVRNLRFHYASQGHDVLAIPALDIAGSGLTALVGASGAGKSTLVELLAGTLREPYEGTIETLGVDITTLHGDAERQRHLRRIGFIPQDFGLLPGRSIRQILEQDLSDAEIPRDERGRRIEDAIEAVGLSAFLDRPSNELSGGQRQRTAIARMLARDVELVIADEPTANLDPQRAREMLELFRQMAATRPVIIVTHDPWLASECQRTVLLQAASIGGDAHANDVSSTSPKAPPRRGRRRWMLAAALIVLLVAGGASVVALHPGGLFKEGSPVAATAPPSHASSISATSPPATPPPTPVTATVTLCQTGYGLQAPTSLPAVPASMLLTTPPPTGQVAWYVSSLLFPVLAPTGWTCESGVGADGGQDTTAIPAGSDPQAPSQELYTYTNSGGCQGCLYMDACRFFQGQLPSGVGQGLTCPTAPAGEVVSQVTPTAIIYTDPSGSGGASSGLAAGDPNPLMGAVVLGSVSGCGGSCATDWTDTCVLPAQDSPLCRYLLLQFITWVDTEGASQLGG